MATVHLRPYQVECIEALRRSYAAGARSPLLQLPTGGGKTHVFTQIVGSANARGNRVCVVAHRRELIAQASKKLADAGVAHGIIAPGCEPNDYPVQVASIQTLARRLDTIGKFNLLVLDECHHAVAGQWAALLQSQPDARLLGVTATPERLDGKGLGTEAGGPFDDLVIGPSVQELSDAGYLTRTRVFAPQRAVDLSGVKTRAGDFAVDGLAALMSDRAIVGDAVAHYSKHAHGLPAIAFCCTVAHAESVAQSFRSAGYRSVCVHGGMKATERDAAISGLADGSVQVLANCDLISEGLDVPNVGAVILLRPTQSLTLHLQQIGRGLRPAPGKSHLIVLDHSGNCVRHGRAEDDREWSLAGYEARSRKSKARQVERALDQRSLRKIEEIEGELAEMSRLRTEPRGRLLTGRETRARLEQIRIARGYRPGWVWHALREQRALRARSVGGAP